MQTGWIVTIAGVHEVRVSQKNSRNFCYLINDAPVEVGERGRERRFYGVDLGNHVTLSWEEKLLDAPCTSQGAPQVD